MPLTLATLPSPATPAQLGLSWSFSVSSGTPVQSPLWGGAAPERSTQQCRPHLEQLPAAMAWLFVATKCSLCAAVPGGWPQGRAQPGSHCIPRSLGQTALAELRFMVSTQSCGSQSVFASVVISSPATCGENELCSQASAAPLGRDEAEGLSCCQGGGIKP